MSRPPVDLDSFDTPIEVRMTLTSRWQDLYEAAVLETDWSRMEDRIQTAESAIKERLDELFLTRGGTPKERQAIVDTLNRLTGLRAEVASWRESKSAS